jgi:hypothetical protein
MKDFADYPLDDRRNARRDARVFRHSFMPSMLMVVSREHQRFAQVMPDAYSPGEYELDCVGTKRTRHQRYASIESAVESAVRYVNSGMRPR